MHHGRSRPSELSQRPMHHLVTYETNTRPYCLRNIHAWNSVCPTVNHDSPDERRAHLALQCNERASRACSWTLARQTGAVTDADTAGITKLWNQRYTRCFEKYCYQVTLSVPSNLKLRIEVSHQNFYYLEHLQFPLQLGLKYATVLWTIPRNHPVPMNFKFNHLIGRDITIFWLINQPPFLRLTRNDVQTQHERPSSRVSPVERLFSRRANGIVQITRRMSLPRCKVSQASANSPS